MAKRLTVISALLAISLGAALLETYLLWGYFWSRPTLAHQLSDATDILGVSVVEVDAGRLRRTSNRQHEISRATSACRPWTNECRDGVILLALEDRVSTGALAEVDFQLAESAWVWAQRSGWRPHPSDERYAVTSLPVSGSIVHFAVGPQRYILVGARTSEIANDKYAYVESLISADGQVLELVDQTHFILDIAGLEGLTWPVLWPLNAVAFLVAFGCWAGARRLVSVRREHLRSD